MLYIYLLEDMITDANTEEESTISTSRKEDLSTGLFFSLENPWSSSFTVAATRYGIFNKLPDRIE
jgi:hypothetical protein